MAPRVSVLFHSLKQTLASRGPQFRKIPLVVWARCPNAWPSWQPVSTGLLWLLGLRATVRNQKQTCPLLCLAEHTQLGFRTCLDALSAKWKTTGWQVKVPISRAATEEMNLWRWQTSLGPSWACPSIWCLLTEADTIILMQGWVPGSWLLLKLTFQPMVREPHHKGLCSACSWHTDQVSDPSWGYGCWINTVCTSAHRPTDSDHTIVTLGTHRWHQPGWLDYLSLSMVCPSSKATPSALTVWLNAPHLLLSTHLCKALWSVKTAVPRKR